MYSSSIHINHHFFAASTEKLRFEQVGQLGSGIHAESYKYANFYRLQLHIAGMDHLLKMNERMNERINE